MHIPEYSLVIFSSPAIITQVHTWKKFLETKINWFRSVNSKAHITILTFDLNTADLDAFKIKITKFCEKVVPEEVSFDSFKSFGVSIFYVSPSKNSSRYLNNIIRHFHSLLGVRFKNVNTHMTIARELDEIRMNKAFDLFKDIEVNLNFHCDKFSLRRFNNTTKQYSDVIAEFKFRGMQQFKLF